MRLASSSMISKGSSDNRRYRTRAPTSQVDETLFGNPKPISPDKSGNSTFKAKDKFQKNQGETVQIITKDLIRNLRVPWKDPSGESIILPPAEFKRITSTSRVLTKEERVALHEAYQRKKEEEIKAAEERKRQIYEADLSRKENHALTELELEARDRAQRLVERANALRLEQEEEIKKLNQLILGAQCQATRDAQIQEKKQIQVELTEEEKRLDTMMEVERRKALETVEQIEELRKKQRISGMQQIYDQIKKRLEEKQLQDEMKELERQQIRENQEKMTLEDLKTLEKKKEEQQRLHEEVLRINAETMQAKEQRREEEKMADKRDMEFIKKKMEREAEYEAEQRRIKKEKELEIARLRARQEKAKDYKAEQDDLRARRNQEIMDREWRRKEKEMAVKKSKEEAMLRAARLEQVHCKEHFLSIEAGREKAEFERVLKVQQEAIAKQMEEEEKQHQKAQRHSLAIRHQVKERELSAIAQRREIFKEADRLIEEARQRRMRLDDIKEKKLKELKATGLSEKYCSEVERKARDCSESL
ncbi:cilia- and flagella-associated protein 45 [Seriola dumerili]|uniref:cilia- and flagella-associated protein 45 n=1 Tax=Seriola dumerili TaxID=41447 RepID=UPI000BBEAAF5|nr:cilia- and flagella-associated protein 45 [Seriola dumerili]